MVDANQLAGRRDSLRRTLLAPKSVSCQDKALCLAAVRVLSPALDACSRRVLVASRLEMNLRSRSLPDISTPIPPVGDAIAGRGAACGFEVLQLLAIPTNQPVKSSWVESAALCGSLLDGDVLPWCA